MRKATDQKPTAVVVVHLVLETTVVVLVLTPTSLRDQPGKYIRKISAKKTLQRVRVEVIAHLE